MDFSAKPRLQALWTVLPLLSCSATAGKCGKRCRCGRRGMIKRFVGACIRGEEDEAVTQRQGNAENGAVVEREEAE